MVKQKRRGAKTNLPSKFVGALKPKGSLPPITTTRGKTKVGIYTEYLDKQMGFEELSKERKVQLRRISELRGGRDILVYATDQNPTPLKTGTLLSINYSDLLPINDQLTNLSGNAIDLILETPGGAGETAEDIVRLLHNKYDEVGVIVPGSAKSAGTIIAMAGDEILMEPASALGPIDAQIIWQGKSFSADALIEGMEKIKDEVITTGDLNKAYIPILQSISPGELQSAENALNFAKVLVGEWLVKYKFKNWMEHRVSKDAVTEEEKKELAERIATKLCNHRFWLTHGRSIKIPDLEGMGLRVTDYSQNADLAEAIRRYHTLVQITFATNCYKLFETPDSQIYKFVTPQMGPLAQVPGGLAPAGAAQAEIAHFDFQCPNCKRPARLQANLDKPKPLQPGCILFPKNNKFNCPGCKAQIDLSDLRLQIEAQAKKKIV